MLTAGVNYVVAPKLICAILACVVFALGKPHKLAIYLELPKLVGNITHMINDHISDMFTRLSNAYAVGKKTVDMPFTKMCEAVAKVMLEEKYLRKVEAVSNGKAHSTLKLTLAYQGSTPSVSHIRRISKPGVRIYRSLSQFKPILSGLGISILSTSRGIMSDRQARLAHLGGEVLVELW